MAASSIGIIGGGPMAVYLLKELILQPDPQDITIFEASDKLGVGMPYRADLNSDFMLCNAFSREIPPVTQPLVEWLRDLPERRLTDWELMPHDVNARAFYPRLLIGEYYASEFTKLCELAQNNGHKLNVLPQNFVEDICPQPHGIEVTVQGPRDPASFLFGTVVIATGHVWSDAPKIGTATLVSPWPADALAKIPANRVGILGSSLSAIDVLIALGHAHGTFHEDNTQIRWFPNDTAHDLRITMVSRKGIMPEADFYYAIPYEPLQHLTEDNVATEIERGSMGLLERVFGLLVQELEATDPDSLEGLGPDARTIAGFAEGYFARRQEFGGLKSLRETLAESRKSIQLKETVRHRSVLLRGHEVFDAALRAMTPWDWDTFSTCLMPVFADCYAAVPHFSVARVLALFEAGVLELVPTGDDSEFSETPSGNIEVVVQDDRFEFDVLIDARGQASAELSDLPFPSLVSSLSADQAPLEEPFRLTLPWSDNTGSAVYCLAMPQIMCRYPFSQGLANCADLAKLVAIDIISGRSDDMKMERAIHRKYESKEGRTGPHVVAKSIDRPDHAFPSG